MLKKICNRKACVLLIILVFVVIYSMIFNEATYIFDPERDQMLEGFSFNMRPYYNLAKSKINESYRPLVRKFWL